jgi:F-box/leucine-rich repeat protein 7
MQIISDDGEIEFAELNRGSYFGEIGIMFNIKRTATVVAKTPSILLCLTSEQLHSVLQGFPEVLKSLQESGHQRLRDLTQEYERSGKKMPLDLLNQIQSLGYDIVLFY